MTTEPLLENLTFNWEDPTCDSDQKTKSVILCLTSSQQLIRFLQNLKSHGRILLYKANKDQCFIIFVSPNTDDHLNEDSILFHLQKKLNQIREGKSLLRIQYLIFLQYSDFKAKTLFRIGFQQSYLSSSRDETRELLKDSFLMVSYTTRVQKKQKITFSKPSFENYFHKQTSDCFLLTSLAPQIEHKFFEREENEIKSQIVSFTSSTPNDELWTLVFSKYIEPLLFKPEPFALELPPIFESILRLDTIIPSQNSLFVLTKNHNSRCKSQKKNGQTTMIDLRIPALITDGICSKDRKAPTEIISAKRSQHLREDPTLIEDLQIYNLKKVVKFSSDEFMDRGITTHANISKLNNYQDIPFNNRDDLQFSALVSNSFLTPSKQDEILLNLDPISYTENDGNNSLNSNNHFLTDNIIATKEFSLLKYENEEKLLNSSAFRSFWEKYQRKSDRRKLTILLLDQLRKRVLERFNMCSIQHDRKNPAKNPISNDPSPVKILRCNESEEFKEQRRNLSLTSKKAEQKEESEDELLLLLLDRVLEFSKIPKNPLILEQQQRSSTLEDSRVEAEELLTITQERDILLEEKNRSQMKLDQLSKDNQALTDTLKEKEEMSQQLISKVDSLQNDLTLFTKDKENLVNIRNSLDQKLDTTKGELETITNQYTEITARHEECITQLETVQDNLKNSKQIQSQLEIAIQKLQDDIKLTEQRSLKYETKAEKLEKEKIVLDDEIQRMRESLIGIIKCTLKNDTTTMVHFFVFT